MLTMLLSNPALTRIVRGQLVDSNDKLSLTTVADLTL